MIFILSFLNYFISVLVLSNWGILSLLIEDFKKWILKVIGYTKMHNSINKARIIKKNENISTLIIILVESK